MKAQSYRVISALLCYPQAELIAALDELALELAPDTELTESLAGLLHHLASTELITLQQDYVQTFDRNPGHSLHLFEHIHGEDRARGQAMVDLIAEYRSQGFEPVVSELPDYVPLFLEFLSLCNPEEAGRLLGDAVHVLAHVEGKLREHHSPYAPLLAALVRASPIAPQPLTEPPVRDMDEALETFGPSADGVEPLLQPSANFIAPVNFYPRHAGAPR